MALSLSRRSQPFDAPDAPNAITEAVLSRRASGRPLLDLTGTNPTVAGLPYDLDALRAALAEGARAPYEPSPFGLEAARTAVADMLRSRDVPTDPDRIVLTASTSEAYAFLFKLLCDPGDAVLVPQPSYPLFEHLTALEGVTASPYPLAYDGAWYVDLPALAARVTPRTRAVVVVHPNNPTGSFLRKDELAAIASLGLPIISDEVFGAYALRDDVARARTALGAPAPLVFVMGGLSKFAAMPQLKLAWIAVSGEDAEVRQALSGLELVADTFLSPNGPVQRALPAILEASRGVRDAIVQRLRANVAELGRASANTAITPLPVDGGWTAVVRLPAVRSEESWALGLLEEGGVLVQPGYFYDMAEEPFVVVSLLTPEADFARGVRLIRDHVERES